MYRVPFILDRDAAGDIELQTLILPEGIAVPDQNSLKILSFANIYTIKPWTGCTALRGSLTMSPGRPDC